MILLIHQHFPLAFFLLPQVFVDTSTLPILVELELDFVDTSTFFHWLSSCCLRFLLIHQHSLFWWSLNLILLIHQHFPLAFFLLTQVFVDTSTLLILVELELDFADTSTFFHRLSSCCLRFLLIHQHSLFWRSLNLILVIH